MALQAQNQEGVRSDTNVADVAKTLYTATGKATLNNCQFANITAGTVTIKLEIANVPLVPLLSLEPNEVQSLDGVYMLESGEAFSYTCNTLNGVAIHASILEVA